MGGSQYQAKCLVDELKQTGDYEISYIARNFDPHHEAEGYRLLKVGNALGIRRGRLFLDAPQLLRTLREIEPHVVYQRVGCAYGGIAAHYARRHGCRMVWHIAHDMEVTRSRLPVTPDFLDRYIDRKLLEYGIREATDIVAQTEAQAALLKRHYGREATAVIPNFHPFPQERIVKDGPVTVVWVANLKPFKRPDVFVELVKDIGDKCDARFVMVGAWQGDAGWREKLRSAMESTPRLSYVGPLTQEQVNELLASAHVFVNTSRQEGFANTFIQAWMRQVPVVSLSVNPDGVFDKGAVGYCTQTYEALRERVLALVLDRKRCAELGAAAQSYALERHSLRNVVQLRAIFERASE